jgi:hypothetical protein
MVEHAENLEPSYNVGISPNREYHTTSPFPGTESWPAKGWRVDKAGQKLHSAASVHDFFRTAVLPGAHAAAQHAAAQHTTSKVHAAAQHALGLDAQSKKLVKMDGKAVVAALPYVQEADAAEHRATERAATLKRDLHKALSAEHLAAVARQQAVKVGEAAAQADTANHKLSEMKKAFRSNMAKVESVVPPTPQKKAEAAAAPRKASKDNAVRQQKATAEAQLDGDVEKDKEENKALSKPSDLSAFLSTVNSNSYDRTDRYREPHAPAVEPGTHSQKYFLFSIVAVYRRPETSSPKSTVLYRDCLY